MLPGLLYNESALVAHSLPVLTLPSASDLAALPLHERTRHDC